jgi:hypothetical protein
MPSVISTAVHPTGRRVPSLRLRVDMLLSPCQNVRVRNSPAGFSRNLCLNERPPQNASSDNESRHANRLTFSCFCRRPFLSRDHSYVSGLKTCPRLAAGMPARNRSLMVEGLATGLAERRGKSPYRNSGRSISRVVPIDCKVRDPRTSRLESAATCRHNRTGTR